MEKREKICGHFECLDHDRLVRVHALETPKSPMCKQGYGTANGEGVTKSGTTRVTEIIDGYTEHVS